MSTRCNMTSSVPPSPFVWSKGAWGLGMGLRHGIAGCHKCKGTGTPAPGAHMERTFGIPGNSPTSVALSPYPESSSSQYSVALKAPCVVVCFPLPVLVPIFHSGI